MSLSGQRDHTTLTASVSAYALNAIVFICLALPLWVFYHTFWELQQVELMLTIMVRSTRCVLLDSK